MIGWLGIFALALAFCAALLTTAAAGRAAVRADARPADRQVAELPLVRAAAVVTLLGVGGAVTAVEWALVSHDFSLRFVADHGSRATPLYYTVTSLWAAHDGSLLLWNLVLAAVLGWLAVSRRRAAAAPALHAWAVAVTAAVSAFFLGLALFTTRVFDRVVPVPADGPGPTPLLQDHPAMGVHPPLLYVGLVGLVVPFGYAVGALVTGRVQGSWLSAATGPLRLGWIALTAGIALGAWWSYAVLGWGGYWVWDPIENASLMPWLVATALLHSAMVQRRNGALPVWNVGLAIGAFLLAALATLLTRSGLVSSVHSFADSQVGPVLLGFVAALVAGVLGIVAARGGRLAPREPVGSLLSRGFVVLLNNVVLVTLALTVLLGTLLPIAVESFSGRRVSVGPPYYNRVALPLLVLLLALMVVGPVLRWARDDAARVLHRLAVPVVVGAVVVTAVAVLRPGGVLAALAFGAAATVVASALVETALEARRVVRRRAAAGAPALTGWLRRRLPVLGGRLVHVGVAVVAVGIAGSAAYTTSTERSLRVGETVAVDGARATLEGVSRDRDERVMRTGARLSWSAGADGGTLEPSLRHFPAHRTTVAGPAIATGLTRDVYLTVLSVGERGDRATVRLAVNPMVGWIWAGAVLMVLGGALAARRRERDATSHTPSHTPSHTGSATTGPARVLVREGGSGP